MKLFENRDWRTEMSYGNGGEAGYAALGGMDSRTLQAANVPTAVPAVLGELDAQRKTLGMLAEITMVLEQRLQPVLAAVPDIQKDSKDAMPTPNQIAARIGDHTRGMRLIHERLGSILSRLEV